MSRAWVLWGLGLFGVLVAIRSVAFGIGVEDRGSFGIGGSTAAWMELSRVLSVLAPVTALAAIAAAVALWIPRARRRAMFALTLLVVANVGTLCAKVAATWVLPDGRGTLPSGHTMLALTSAAVVVLLTPGPWREVGLPLGGFLGALGPLGVIAAFWHTPCDPSAAVALLPLWLWVSVRVTQILLGQRSVRGGPRTRVHTLPRARHLVPGADIPTWLLLGTGAAGTGVMLAGWGFEPQQSSVWNIVLGVGEFLGLPMLVTIVLVEVARVGEELGEPKH